MGLDYNHYMLIGADVSAKRKKIDEDDDKFLPYIEGHQGIEMSIVDDLENRKFLYFGKVLARGDKYEGIKTKALGLAELQTTAEEVAAAYKELFEEDIEMSKIKLVACTVIW